MNRRLSRCRQDRVLAGVAAGVAEYLDIDPTIVRVLWVFSVFFGGIGLLLYVVMAIIVPNEPEEGRVAAAGTLDPTGEAVAAPATGWHAVPAAHRHGSRGTGRVVTFFGAALILFGSLALVNAVAPDWADAGRFLWPVFLLGVGVDPARRRGTTGAGLVVIGAAVLVVGLLVLLAAFMAGKSPGGAMFASSGLTTSPETGAGTGQARLAGPLRLARPRDPIRAFLLSPIHPATWHATAAIVRGLFVAVLGFALLLALASVGFGTLPAGIGVVFLALGIESARLVARVERRRVTAGTDERLVAHPYRPLRGGVLAILRAEFADESRWRDVLYVALNLPLTVIEFVVVATTWAAALGLVSMPLWYDPVAGSDLPAFLEPFSGGDPLLVVLRTLLGVALLPIAASLAQLVLALHRGLVVALLSTSESRELRRQVETLKESRSAVLDVEASELHRIERDLHDGAQQRLVMLTIDLGLASERIDSDPEAARQLVLQGQEQARQALSDLRDLVRGIAPSILIDRGLVPAISSIAGRGPVPTSVRSDLPPGERLPAAVERAAYFVVAEALANMAKHSDARSCEVRCRRDGSRLVVEVWDDGKGGAAVDPGGGLAGLAARVAAVDGSLTVSSPPGGPTIVRAELPVR